MRKIHTLQYKPTKLVKNQRLKHSWSMSVIQGLSKSRPAQIGVVILVFLVYYLFARTDKDEFSPEDLNSLLQNKDSETVAVKKVELTGLGLEAPYLNPTTFKLKNWDLAGNLVTKNNEYMRITSDHPHQVGNMFSKLPIQAESFEMELTFHIHSKNKNELIGDGFAMWIIDEKSDIGDVFGARNNFKGMGIFVDTYKNGKRGHFPYVNLMLGDGIMSYNKDTDGFETRLAGCSGKELINPHGGKSKARIVYIKDGYFSLDFNFNNEHEKWTNCVTLTDIQLPQIKYLGLSAETGELSQTVDIYENKVFALYNPEGSYIESVKELERMIEEQAEPVPPPEERKGGRNRAFKKKKTASKRKSLTRLKKAEKRIKERERKLRLEKYGDENATFINRFIKKIKFVVKVVFYTLLAACIGWVAYILYRMQKQKSKAGRSGLLD